MTDHATATAAGITPAPGGETRARRDRRGAGPRSSRSRGRARSMPTGGPDGA